MVDSRESGAMAERIDHLEVRVKVVEQRVDQLSESVDRQFEAFREPLAELRKYTEHAYEKLDTKMDAGFARLDMKIASLDAKMDAGFVKVDATTSRIERKLDQFIDLQLKANQLVERRLRALEQ